ncbi:MAG: hypothetical protein AB7G44_06245 [Bacteroidia bacterium]
MRFIDATDEQVKWGNNDDPRLVLEKGRIYEIEDAEIHSYHTKLSFVGINGKFNSVCFEWIDHMSFKGRAELGFQKLKEQEPITIEIAREQVRWLKERSSLTKKKQRPD